MDQLPLELINEIGLRLPIRDRWHLSRTCRHFYHLLNTPRHPLYYFYQRRQYYRIIDCLDRYSLAIDDSHIGKDPLLVGLCIAKGLNLGVTILTDAIGIPNNMTDQQSIDPTMILSNYDLFMANVRRAHCHNSRVFSSDSFDPVAWNHRLNQRDLIIVNLHWDTLYSWIRDRLIDAITAGCRVLILTPRLTDSSDTTYTIVKLIQALPIGHSWTPVIASESGSGSGSILHPLIFTMNPKTN
jgi:hypothetical protein